VGIRANQLAAAVTKGGAGKPPPVAALVYASRSGDSEAFATLYLTYRREVRGTIKSVLRNENDVDEALQQTFLRAWHGLAAFDPARGSFAAWLNRIAANHAYDLLRARARYDLAGNDTVASMRRETTPKDLIADDSFRASLRLLSKEQRAVIVLRFQFDWSIAEIADQLGSTTDAIAQLQRRALRRLRAGRSTRREAPV
jgi:RNA polymerase sigma-70 factor (ECF subfamily)